MAENVTRVTLPQLVDLSLNCPDVGTLNFNILHTLLQVLIHQLNQDGTAIEFRGKDSDRVQGLIKATKPGSVPLTLSEYNVVAGQDNKKKSPPKEKKSRESKKISLTDVKMQSKLEVQTEKQLKIIHPRKDSWEEPKTQVDPMQSPPRSAHSFKTVVVVHPDGHSPQSSVAITKESFEAMVNDIQRLKDKIRELMELPGNLGLIEAAKKQDSSPILEMFNVIQLNKRMEASEKTVEKLISLVEDMAKGKEAGDLGGREKSEPMFGPGMDSRDIPMGGRTPEELHDLEQRVIILEENLAALAEGGGIDMKNVGVGNESHKTTPLGGVSSEESVEVRKGTKKHNVQLSNMSPDEAIAVIQEELQALNDLMNAQNFIGILKDVDMLKSKLAGDRESHDVSFSTGYQTKTGGADNTDKIETITHSQNNKISALQAQVSQLQKEMMDALKTLDALLPGGDASGLEGQGILDLYNRLVQLQEEVNSVVETGNSLMEEKSKREQSMEVMLEQIELLRIVKANREDIEEVLGEKADACAVNRKVSHDQFESACDDLSRGVEDALKKLTQQEEMWQQALEDIQREIGNKLDKMEVDPLRDFVNSKLKMLHERLKTLMSLQQSREAAGTKSKILRDVNCISCDRDVIMKREMDASLKPQPAALPPPRNIAPYLAYELDQLRKQQKCIPGSKNLNHFESALKQVKASKEKDHLCNRYCGGSHTITTPQQRVSRMGHFLDQWGSEMDPESTHRGKGEGSKKKQSKKGSFQVESKALFDDEDEAEEEHEQKISSARSQSAGRVIVNEEAKELLESASVTKTGKSRPRSSVDVPPRSLSFTYQKKVSIASGQGGRLSTSRVSKEFLVREEIDDRHADGQGVKFAMIEEIPERGDNMQEGDYGGEDEGSAGDDEMED